MSLYPLSCYIAVSQVLKLHTKLGKPIPSTEPVIVSANTTTTATTAGKTTATTTPSSTKATAIKTTTTSVPAAAQKVVATPKITFVGGTQLKTPGAKTEEVKSLKVDDPSLSDSNSKFFLCHVKAKMNRCNLYFWVHIL